MTSRGVTIRHLVFNGPRKEQAKVDFCHGLNVVYGASETGKSFILEAIDFMLGGGRTLRDIPERVGYDRVFLGLEDSEGDCLTLTRATSGGQFVALKGLHSSWPEGGKGTTLAAKHSARQDTNVSTALLAKLKLGGKRIRRNRDGDTNSLSFRNLVHLCVVSEEEIQKRGSPIETGQAVTKTADMSVFKLLLTGVDDSAVQPARAETTKRATGEIRGEVIENLIDDYMQRLHELVGEEDQPSILEQQLSRLDESLEMESSTLSQVEDKHRQFMKSCRQNRERRGQAQERRDEIDEVLARFALLDKHYGSDYARLEALREAGTLVGKLSQQVCPLCGAAPADQHQEVACDGDVARVVQATGAEREKISVLRRELRESVAQLEREAAMFDEQIVQLDHDLQTVQYEMDVLSRSVDSQRRSYADLADKRATVQMAVRILDTIASLRKEHAALASKLDSTAADDDVTDELSKHTLNQFAERYEALLRTWSFPDPDRVFFDSVSRDFVINGKPRGSRGKGLRAITYAAFVIALMEFGLDNDLCHPGFVVLDSPLLAYREPEGEDDDLTGTDVQDRFYEYLMEQSSGQTIIFENVTPPAAVRSSTRATMFTKNPGAERYGFFPRLGE